MSTLLTATLNAISTVFRLVLFGLMIVLPPSAGASSAPAFAVSAKVVGARTVRLHWDIPTGSFLIRESIHIDSMGGGVRLAPLVMPSAAPLTGTCLNPALATDQHALDVDLVIDHGAPSLPFMLIWHGCNAEATYPQDHVGILVSLTSLGATEDRVTLGDATLLARAYAAGAARPVIPWLSVVFSLLGVLPLVLLVYVRSCGGTYFVDQEFMVARNSPWIIWPIALMTALLVGFLAWLM